MPVFFVSQSSVLYSLWRQLGPAGFYQSVRTYLFTDGMGGALKFSFYEKLTSWCHENLS